MSYLEDAFYNFLNQVQKNGKPYNSAPIEKAISEAKMLFDDKGMAEALAINGMHLPWINFRQPFFNLIYLHLSGACKFKMVSRQVLLKPNDLIILPENSFYISQFNRTCKGYCVRFMTEFVQPLLNTNPLGAIFPFFEADLDPVINLKTGESRIIQHDLRDIIGEYKRSVEKADLIRTYIYIMLLHIREIYKPSMPVAVDRSSQSMKLAHHFRNLLEKNFMQIRSVAEYADMLNISPKHLTEVVKSIFRKTPRQMINEILLREAKVLLKFSEMTVSEIAFRFHFQDHSHFNHFIRQHAGCTPLELRKKL